MTRLRLLAHLSDSRRPRCRDELLSGFHLPLSAEETAELDAKDTEAKREAARSGHSHVIAAGAARTRDGKLLGRVSE